MVGWSTISDSCYITENKNDPDINSHKYSHLVFNKDAHWRKNSSQINGAMKTNFWIQEQN